MPMNDRKGKEYHAINNTIDKQLSSLKVKIYFFAMSKGQAKLSWRLRHNPKFTLSTANIRMLRVFPLQVLASSCLLQQILNFPSNLTHFDKPKNSLELPNPRDVYATVQIN